MNPDFNCLSIGYSQFYQKELYNPPDTSKFPPTAYRFFATSAEDLPDSVIFSFTMNYTKTLAELLGISLAPRTCARTSCFFLLEFWFGRKYIGLGTFVNGICIGYIVTAFYDPIHAHFGDAPSLAVQLAWVIAAVLVTALGASLYQTADLGIAPYDYLSLGLRDYTPCPYFGCRIFTDALSALLCWLLGGLVGLGTLICAFCLGPFIQFFDRTFSQKVLQYKPNN